MTMGVNDMPKAAKILYAVNLFFPQTAQVLNVKIAEKMNKQGD